MTRTVDNSCSWFKPVYLKDTDVLADDSFNQIKNNNELWLSHCKTKK